MNWRLAELDIPFARSKVGDRYVMELLVEKGWRIGGENSGHVHESRSYAGTGDGIIASLASAGFNDRHQSESLADLSHGMTKLPQVLVNVKFEKGTAPLENLHVKEVIATG